MIEIRDALSLEVLRHQPGAIVYQSGVGQKVAAYHPECAGRSSVCAVVVTTAEGWPAPQAKAQLYYIEMSEFPMLTVVNLGCPYCSKSVTEPAALRMD